MRSLDFAVLIQRSGRGWRRSYALGLAWLVAAAVSGCAGETTAAQTPELRLELEEDGGGVGDYLLDFGLVPVGSEEIRAVRLRNTGNTPLVIAPDTVKRPFFVVDGERRTIAVGADDELHLGFAPTKASERAEQALLTLQTNERATSGQRTIRLLGRGAFGRLDCEPGEVDFRSVLLGRQATARVRCENPLSIPLVATAAIGGNHGSSFSVEGLEGGTVEVPALGAVEFELLMRASILGENGATLTLRASSASVLATVPLNGVVVSSALQIEPDDCLAFGYVPLGSSKAASLLLRNLGEETISIAEVKIAESGDGQFRLLSELPIELAPDEASEVEVEFQPTSGGQQTAALELVLAGGGTSVSACVSGFGGGPILSCRPDSIDFGVTLVGMERIRTFSCANAGYAPEGASVDPLIVEEISIDHSAFSATIRNLDGSEGPKASGYLADETFELEVRWSPEEEGFQAAAVSIAANDSPAPHLYGVAGEARDLPPCEIRIAPPTLRFGMVDVGERVTRIVSIVNTLETACLIDDLRLASGDPEIWSVEPIDFVELEGEGRLDVEVHFQPTVEETSLGGSIRFSVSDPDEPERTILLSGSAGRPCLLIDPHPIDFGFAGVGCFTRERLVSVRNGCNRDITLQAASMDDSPHSESFEIISRPTLPKVLGTNEWVDFEIRFRPGWEGVTQAGLVIEGMYRLEPFLQLAHLHGEAIIESQEQIDTFTQIDQRKVDILWVMDNSGSMDPYQDRIAENLPAFISYADEENIDYHIGVTTTGLDSSGLGCPGGVEGGEDGRLFPVNGSAPRILTPRTPNLQRHWENNMTVGTCHSLEYAYEAARRALSSPLIEEAKDSRYLSPWDDGNAGFLRPDASLSVILVSDEREQSVDRFGRSIAEYIEFFQRVKGVRNAAQFKLHAIAGPALNQPKLPGCSAEEGDGFIAGVELTHGAFLDICTPTDDRAAWEEGLRQMSGAAFNFTTRFFLSSDPHAARGRPRETDLEVIVEGRKIEHDRGGTRVWNYDPNTNSIDFSPLFAPKPGAPIEIRYTIACLSN